MAGHSTTHGTVRFILNLNRPLWKTLKITYVETNCFHATVIKTLKFISFRYFYEEINSYLQIIWNVSRWKFSPVGVYGSILLSFPFQNCPRAWGCISAFLRSRIPRLKLLRFMFNELKGNDTSEWRYFLSVVTFLCDVPVHYSEMIIPEKMI